MQKWIVILVTLSAALGLAACGGGSTDVVPQPPVATTASPKASTETLEQSEPAATTATVQIPTPTPETSQEQAATAEEADPRPRGGVLRMLWSDPPTLDPHLSGDTTSAFIVNEIYSGLVRIDTELRLVPDLAERLEVDETGTVYTFYLRENARFQDSKQVTAQDFKWSMERAADPDTGSPVADAYLNDIVGASDVFDGNVTAIHGIQVIDDQTLQITIDQPKPYFLAKLAYPTAFVLDRATVEAGGSDWTRNPNGTGPFKLKEYVIGDRLVLERNDNYYLEPAYLDRVEMNLAGGQSMAMYQNDEIDVTGVGLFDLEPILDPNNPLFDEQLVAPPGFEVIYIGFNTAKPPFDDVKFRQALNHAIDKELIAEAVLLDREEPAYGILPPNFPGYNPDLVGLGFDPELARRLLQESKYADPESRPRIILTVPSTTGQVGPSLEVVVEMWRQTLGVEVEIQGMEWAAYLIDLDAGKFDAYAGLGWQADYPDPQDFLDVLFHSDSSLNHTNYHSPEVDSLVEAARTEPDTARRVELYHEAEQIIVRDAPWAPLWFSGEGYLLVKPYVTGYKVPPFTLSKLKEVYFEYEGDSASDSD